MIYKVTELVVNKRTGVVEAASPLSIAILVCKELKFLRLRSTIQSAPLSLNTIRPTPVLSPLFKPLERMIAGYGKPVLVTIYPLTCSFVKTLDVTTKLGIITTINSVMIDHLHSIRM